MKKVQNIVFLFLSLLSCNAQEEKYKNYRDPLSELIRSNHVNASGISISY